MEIPKAQQLYIYLSAIFVAALILGDLTGGKAFSVHLHLGARDLTLPMSVGLFAFPATFLLTDIVNDFYGAKGAKFLTFLGMWMSVFSYVVLNVSQWPHADPQSYLQDNDFNKVFGVGGKLFIASIIAYLCGQFLDIYVFQFWKALTQSKHLWLRATGSTIASQVIDTFVINLLFWWVFPQFGSQSARPLAWVMTKATSEYVVKLIIAIALTPAVYAVHDLVAKRMGIEPEGALAHEHAAAD